MLSLLSLLIGAASSTPEPVLEFVPAIAQVRCSVLDLVSSSLADCTTLDLRSNALHSLPVWENVTFTDNQTFAMLSDALWDKERAPLIHTLLFSDSVSLAEDEARFLGMVAPRLYGLTTLALDGCNLTALAAEAVVNSTLVAGSPMRALTLARNAIGADGAKAIARQLAYSDQLSMLQLSETALTPAGGELLAESLGNGAGAGLEELALDQSDIGDAGAIALGQALARASGAKLRLLDLSGNSIGQIGGASFGRSLAEAEDGTRADGLRELYLSSNDLGDDGAIAIAAALERRTHLYELSLHDNAILRTGARAIERAMRRNRGLTRIHGLRHNDAWPDDVAYYIEVALARNTEARARGESAAPVPVGEHLPMSEAERQQVSHPLDGSALDPRRLP